MLEIGFFEERVAQMYRQAYIPGFIHLYIGEEAVASGVCGALNKDDHVVSTHWGHAHCVAKGADLGELMAELCGKATGYCKGRGGNTIQEITFVEAIRQAPRNELKHDKSVFMMGEGIGPHGSAFKQTLGLWEEVGDDRVKDTPISESGFTGAAVEAAICGMRPLIDLMFIDFSTVAMDQIINQATKLKYMSGGQLKVPLVLRGNCGAFKSNGPQHSQSLHSWFIHIPGLKVVMPSTPTMPRAY